MRMILILFAFFCIGISSASANNTSVSPDALAALQGRLVRAAADIRTVERRLNDIETRLMELTDESDKLEKEYLARRAKMASTLSALQRMGRMPKEAVFIRPGGPLQAARTSMLLSNSLPGIEKEAADLHVLLSDLQRNRETLAQKAEQASTAKTELKKRHAALNKLMKKRREASSRDMIIWGDESRAVAALAREARSLRDLLGSLDGDDDAKLAALIPVPSGNADDVGQLPVSGIIRTGYGIKDAVGERSSGITIEALPGSIIVTPLAGVVRYAGPFLRYGNIVIIAHAGGYHSLIARMGKITVVAGQTIVSGEPIGILGDGKVTNQAVSQKRETVYFELRHRGRPVNPSKKLPGLGS